MSEKRVKIFRRFGKVLFVFYIIFLLYFLIFSEWYGRVGVSENYRYNLELFKEIKRFLMYRKELGTFAVFTNLFGNILIFVPYGFFISMASERTRFLKSFLYSFVLSFCVEIFQLITRVGSLDVDDILLNVLGGIFGYVSFRICNKIRREYHVR